MHLGQDFPIPKTLFRDQKTLGKNPSFLRSHLPYDLPHTSDGCSGGRQKTRIRGARLDASPVGWEVTQYNYQPRESTALHRFTCTIHHLLTTMFSFCTLVTTKGSYALFPDVQI